MNFQAHDKLSDLERENTILRDEIKVLKRALNNDSFTPTYNRRYFMECLDKACLESRNAFSVLFIDVDGLKTVNDRFGHAVGDEILMQVAHMLNAAISEKDILARLGGDEFGILAYSIADKDNINLAQNIMDNIHTIDYMIDDFKFSVSVSIGMAMGEKGACPSKILEEADQYMYRDKKQKIAFNDNVLYA